MYKIKFYPTRRGCYPVKDFIQEMDKKSRAKIWRYIALLEEYGLNLIRPYADNVRDKIRELRVRVQAGNLRMKSNTQNRIWKILFYGISWENLNCRRCL